MPFFHNNNNNSRGSNSSHTPTMDSSEPQTTTDDSFAAVGNWDTETDHMLSYFLADGEGLSLGGHSSVPHVDFASTSTSSPLSSMAVGGEDRFVDCTHTNNSNSWMLPPPTPAVQFYSRTPVTSNQSSTRTASVHRTSNATSTLLQNNVNNTTTSTTTSSISSSSGSPAMHPLAIATSQSSSSSSLSSMAAALVSGVSPGLRYLSLQQQQQQPLQRTVAGVEGGANHTPILPTPPSSSSTIVGYGGESPISPAAMIGFEHENLLLPPPLTSTSASSTAIYGLVPDRTPHVTTSASAAFYDVSKMGPPEPRPPAAFSWQMDKKIDAVPMAPPPAHVIVGQMFPLPTTNSISAHHQQQQLMYNTTAAMQAVTIQPPSRTIAAPEEESEEKRAKRLERNRESARKCRRRKKERLTSLGSQVNQLHNRIETERKKLIDSMVPALRTCRSKESMGLMTTKPMTPSTEEVDAKLLLNNIVQGTSPSSELMRSVLDFQYSMLKQLTLPLYQKMLLWLTLRDEKYFMAGKEQYVAKMQQTENGASRPVAGKISSKQVGDELFNGPNSKEDKASAKKRNTSRDEDDQLSNTTSNAYDAVRTWPLLCFELKFSVDQEERFLFAHKELSERQIEGRNELSSKRSQMATAVTTTDYLSKAVGSLSHVIAAREGRSLLGILNAKQAMQYQMWLSQNENRERTRRSVAEHGQAPSVQSMELSSATIGYKGNDKEMSLHDIGRRLSAVLQISSKSDE